VAPSLASLASVAAAASPSVAASTGAFASASPAGGVELDEQPDVSAAPERTMALKSGERRGDRIVES
jgi:hypothetical protein